MNQAIRLLAALTAVMGTSPSVAVAQTAGPTYHTQYGISDWRDEASARAVEYKTYWTLVMSNPSYSEDDKAARIAAKYSAMEKDIRAKRRAEYAAVTRSAAVGNSCTNKGSSSKKCDPKCVGEPLPGMYTSLDWVQGWWGGDVDPPSNLKNNANLMGEDRVSGDSFICAGKLKSAGHVRKTSYAEGTFRIRPERIEQMVSAEMSPLMGAVSAAATGQ